jgi:hypothetical protein
MKKVYFALALCCVVSMVFVVSCSKEEQKQEKSSDSLNYEDVSKKWSISTFADLKVMVEVKDGILNFKSVDDWEKVVGFLKKAPKEDILQWENSLNGFTSVHKFAELAKNEFKIDSLNQNKFKELKSKYYGKVNFIDNKERIRPMIENGQVFGRIIGLNGQYKVGKTVVQYFKDKVITVLDGDEHKLNEVKISLKDDQRNGVNVHNLHLKIEQNNTNGLNQRNGWTCPNNCPDYTYRESEGPGSPNSGLEDEEFWLTQEYWAYDNSVFFDEWHNGSYGKTIEMDISVDIDIEHRRLRWWGGWSPTFGGFNWGFGWGIDMGPTVNGVVYPPPYSSGPTDPQQGGGWTWFVSNSDLEVTIPMWNHKFYTFLNATIAINTCIRRSGLVSQSWYNPTGIKNSQYCQDGVTIE